MVAAHYAYNMIKIPATWGIMTIRADIRDTISCVREMHKVAVSSKPGSPSEATLGGADQDPRSLKKRPSLEPS
jgi:hypothetical protein